MLEERQFSNFRSFGEDQSIVNIDTKVPASIFDLALPGCSTSPAHEAELVRQIMQRYLDLGSVAELAEELNVQGYRTKVQRRTSGPQRGGCIFRRGALYHMLSNRIYVGELVHKGTWFDTEHERIVPSSLWGAVQRKLKTSASGSSRRLMAVQPALLIGMLVDCEGRAMTSSHATKLGKRYRYYVTRSELVEGSPAWRVNAHDLEQLVINRLALHLTDRSAQLDLAGEKPAQRSFTVPSRPRRYMRPIYAADQRRRSVDSSERSWSQPRVAELLDLDSASDQQTVILTLPTMKVRRAHQLRLIIPGPNAAWPAPVTRDEKLIALLAEAYSARQLALDQPDRSIAAIASANTRCRTRFGKMLALSCIAPDIVTSIVEGRQPNTLTVRSLMTIELPFAWSEQRSVLGFSRATFDCSQKLQGRDGRDLLNPKRAVMARL